MVSQLDLRFPSMMIREDGQMEVPDVLMNGKIEVPMSLRPKLEPQSPEHLDSQMGTQFRDDWG
jgi:hypothetical protein